jgi:SAM-dependent methyltransferase
MTTVVSGLPYLVRWERILFGDRCAVRQAQTQSDVESAIRARSADVYAGFLLPYLRPDVAVLDCGCGKATITLGLAEAVPDGRFVGVDLDMDGLLAARCSAALIGRGNLACVVADGRRLPFHDAVFDAVLCHSMLETLDDPTNVMAELRRVRLSPAVVLSGMLFLILDFSTARSSADDWSSRLGRFPPDCAAYSTNGFWGGRAL